MKIKRGTKQNFMFFNKQSILCVENLNFLWFFEDVKRDFEIEGFAALREWIFYKNVFWIFRKVVEDLFALLMMCLWCVWCVCLKRERIIHKWKTLKSRNQALQIYSSHSQLSSQVLTPENLFFFNLFNKFKYFFFKAYRIHKSGDNDVTQKSILIFRKKCE